MKVIDDIKGSLFIADPKTRLTRLKYIVNKDLKCQFD